MRFPGEAIGPDSVLAWTGDRELTRFERDGARARVELPFAPLDARIYADHVLAVDERGSVHRFSLAGAPESVVPLLEAPPAIRQAALSPNGDRLAILHDEVEVFAQGMLRPWSFEHRRAPGWRETGVEFPWERHILISYTTTSEHGENLGDDVEAFSITRNDGYLAYRHATLKLPALEFAFCAVQPWLAICEHDRVRIDELGSMMTIHHVAPAGQVQCLRFSGALLGVLFDYELALVHDGTRETRIELPEQFDDIVLFGDEAVCIHPELGAWWVKTSAG